MKIKANQLSSHLQKNLAPCYLVTGDEHLLVDESLDAVRAAARERGFASRDLHVATAGFDWAQLHDAGANMSLFAEKRIVELRLPTGKPGDKGSRELVEIAAAPPPDKILLIITPGLAGNAAKAKWVRALADGGAWVPLRVVTV